MQTAKQLTKRILIRLLRYADIGASKSSVVQSFGQKLEETRASVAAIRSELALLKLDPLFAVLSDLNALYRKCLEADVPNNEALKRQMANHYATCHELLVRHRLMRRNSPAVRAFPDDDWSVEFAKRVGAYVPGNEVEIPNDQPRFSWPALLDDPKCGVFLALGQSNAANHGESRYRPSREVYTLSFLDMRCYRAEDPLPGSSGTGGSVWPRLGDKLIANGTFDRVLFIPIAFGGSFITDWIPGGSMHARVALALERLKTGRRDGAIPISAVLWQQGEAEANHTKMSADAYRLHFADLVAALRSHAVFAPVFISQTTLCKAAEHPFDNRAAIREGQQLAITPEYGILAGPDTDSIGIEHRFDGCHFSDSGLNQCAALWSSTLQAVHALLLKP